MATYLTLDERDLASAKRELYFELNISGKMAEQCAEKSLKAFLELYGYSIFDA